MRATFIRMAACTVIAAQLVMPVGAASSQPRDNDDNAMIYGGAYTLSELRQNLDNGDGHGHSSAQIKNDFAAHNIDEQSLLNDRHTVDGWVTKSGKVIIDDNNNGNLDQGKVVAVSAQ